MTGSYLFMEVIFIFIEVRQRFIGWRKVVEWKAFFEILSDVIWFFCFLLFANLFLLFTKYICCLEKLYNEDRASILEALRDLLFKSKHHDASL